MCLKYGKMGLTTLPELFLSGTSRLHPQVKTAPSSAPLCAPTRDELACCEKTSQASDYAAGIISPGSREDPSPLFTLRLHVATVLQRQQCPCIPSICRNDRITHCSRQHPRASGDSASATLTDLSKRARAYILREGPDRQMQQPGRAGARTCLSLMFLPSAYACSSCRRSCGLPGSAPSPCCSQSRDGGR